SRTFIARASRLASAAAAKLAPVASRARDGIVRLAAPYVHNAAAIAAAYAHAIAGVPAALRAHHRRRLQSATRWTPGWQRYSTTLVRRSRAATSRMRQH
ncbi:MAG: hypothetical protein ABUS54_08140, partial [Actinomycetota bacterium]